MEKCSDHLIMKLCLVLFFGETFLDVMVYVVATRTEELAFLGHAVYLCMQEMDIRLFELQRIYC